MTINETIYFIVTVLLVKTKQQQQQNNNNNTTNSTVNRIITKIAHLLRALFNISSYINNSVS